MAATGRASHVPDPPEQPRPDGQVIFRNDVYGRDKATLAALNAPFTAPR